MTEDTVYMKVQDYINEQNTKSKGTPTKAAAPKTSKEKKSVAFKYSKGKTVSKRTKKINSIAEPIPGTSVLSSKIGLPWKLRMVMIVTLVFMSPLLVLSV